MKKDWFSITIFISVVIICLLLAVDNSWLKKQIKDCRTMRENTCEPAEVIPVEAGGENSIPLEKALENCPSIPCEKEIQEPVEEMTVQEKIRKSAREYGVNEEEALYIAWCESRYDPKAINKTSLATGVFQFLSSTFGNYCEGFADNEDDNIKCFFELYPKHKSWWECKYR